MGKIGATQRIFKQRCFKERARMLVKIHPRMADYIAQAPVIVAAAMTRIPMNLAKLCGAGEKLNVVLKSFCINSGLRGLSPLALDREMHGAVLLLDEAKASAIAQQITKRDAGAQHRYLWQIMRFARRLQSSENGRKIIGWFAEATPEGSEDCEHVADFFNSPNDWRSNWKWRDLTAAMKKWEESFTRPAPERVTMRWWDEAAEISPAIYEQMRAAPNLRDQILARWTGHLDREMARAVGNALDNHMADALRYGMAVTYGGRQMGRSYQAVNIPGTRVLSPAETAEYMAKPLSPHTSAPKTDEVDGYQFELLESPQQLRDEGMHMQHCVGSYTNHVASGRSLIYSIHKGMRIATMELVQAGSDGSRQDRPPTQLWAFEQIKGPKNAPVASEVKKAADAFAAKHFKMTTPKPLDYYSPRFTERLAMRVVRPDPRAIITGLT